MKVLLFSEGMNLIKISGLGRAIMHQQRAMELNGIEYTLDPKDSYDVVHINTLGLKSKHLAKKAKRRAREWCTTLTQRRRTSVIRSSARILFRGFSRSGYAAATAGAML